LSAHENIIAVCIRHGDKISVIPVLKIPERFEQLRISRSIRVGFLKWDRLLACHFSLDRLEAYPTTSRSAIVSSQTPVLRLTSHSLEVSQAKTRSMQLLLEIAFPSNASSPDQTKLPKPEAMRR